MAGLFRDPALARVLVFTRTKRGANRLAEHLDRAGISVDALHGNKSQGARQRSLERFRRGQARVLVATDIAARGLDVDDVSHVINFELPSEPESYVHRIGRTARAGARGVALSLCDASEADHLRKIERLTGRRLDVFAQNTTLQATTGLDTAAQNDDRPGSPPDAGLATGQSPRAAPAPAPRRAGPQCGPLKRQIRSKGESYGTRYR